MGLQGDLDALLRDATDEGHVPGVVALAVGREGTLYEGAFGERALGAGVPMTVDTVFWIASMTKAITGVAVMQQVERGRLDLVRSARVVRIERVRAVDAKLCVVETISVPAGLFPGIAQIELPNTLYSLYATRYGITIATANERLKAVAIAPREAELLQVAAGSPALEIDRVAIDLEERPVEWRLSTCLTQDIHYLSVLR